MLLAIDHHSSRRFVFSFFVRWAYPLMIRPNVDDVIIICVAYDMLMMCNV